MRLNSNFVPEVLYKQFLRRLPLCCIDVVLVSNGKFLLVKRKHNPAKGKWWLPGGRLLRWEHPVHAVRRKLREELGITKIAAVEFLGIGESRFDKGYFGVPYHSVNLTFLARASDAHVKHIALDTVYHTDFRWFARISSPVPAYVAKFLKMARTKL